MTDRSDLIKAMLERRNEILFETWQTVHHAFDQCASDGECNDQIGKIINEVFDAAEKVQKTQ